MRDPQLQYVFGLGLAVYYKAGLHCHIVGFQFETTTVRLRMSSGRILVTDAVLGLNVRREISIRKLAAQHPRRE
jgi:hypothetical protein